MKDQSDDGAREDRLEEFGACAHRVACNVAQVAHADNAKLLHEPRPLHAHGQVELFACLVFVFPWGMEGRRGRVMSVGACDASWWHRASENPARDTRQRIRHMR